MKTIELERWEPKPDDPRYVQYAGPRTAEEVYAELKERLESRGLLPDEYFLLDSEWERGREIPKGADVFCTTDYGGSEGIYLDVYLKWYEDGKPVTRSFITGKTLGESGAELDRMFLISSAITKAFHGDHGTYARYMTVGGVREPETMILSLTPEEQRTFIHALIKQREEMLENVDQTEKLLRRMTGSITEYMDHVGHRPLNISSLDMAMMAIRDGNLDSFMAHYPKALESRDEMLVAAAGKTGPVGMDMTLRLISDEKQYPQTAFKAACKAATEIGAADRVQLLLGWAETNVEDLTPGFYGEMILYALRSKPNVGCALIRDSKPEWIEAAPSELLFQAVVCGSDEAAHTLLKNGIDANQCAQKLLHYLCSSGKEWTAKWLLDGDMRVEPNNYPALHACVSNGGLEPAKVLLEKGMDMEKYQEWLKKTNYTTHGHDDTLQALSEHWERLQEDQPRQEQGPQFGGMSI